MRRIVTVLFCLIPILISVVSFINATAYEYDDLGRLTKATYSSGQALVYEYDPAGNLTKVSLVTPPGMNLPPVLEPIGAKSAVEGRLLQFAVSGSDPGGDALAYSAAGLPRGAAFNPANRTFTWTPDYDQAGDYIVRFVVSDGKYTDTEDVAIHVLDDPSTPVFSIDDVTIVEGDSGTARAVFTVSLSAPSAREASVVYGTADGTAQAGGDYVAQSGRLVFPAGAMSRTVSISIKGDTLAESDETFAVELSAPTFAALGKGSGQGEIKDDDQGAVAVQPVDASTGASPVTITFPVGEDVTVTLTTGSNGPPPPAGFALGDPPIYYELSSSSPLSGPVTVAISYAGISYENEGALRLFHYENGVWADRTLWLNTAADIIYAVVDSFSPFAILQPITAPMMEAPLTWAQILGTERRETLYGLSRFADGNYVAAGEAVSATGDADAWLIKLNTMGNIVWQNAYGGAAEDRVYAVTGTADGGCLAAGETRSAGAGGADLWLLRLDDSGRIIWQKTYGGGVDDGARAVKQTSDGGFLVAGYSYSFGAGHADAWVLRLDATGAVIWQYTYGGGAEDGVTALELTGDGDSILAGYTSSFGSGGQDAWALKLDAEGRVLWQSAYGGPADDAIASLAVALDGGYLLAGSTASYGAGMGDAWVLRLSDYGTVAWQKTYGGMKADTAACITRAGDGYIFTGCTESPGAGNELLAIKISAAGDILWQKTYAQASNDAGFTALETGDGGAIIGGGTAHDIALLRIDAHGQMLASPNMTAMTAFTPAFSDAMTASVISAGQATAVEAVGCGMTQTATLGIQDFLFPYKERFAAYVANANGNSISASLLDPVTGLATPVAGTPFASGARPKAAAVDPSCRFLYVADSGQNTISAYLIVRASGMLIPVPGSPFAVGLRPEAVAVDPAGRFVYVANRGADTVAAFRINQATGGLLPVAGSPFATGSSPAAVAVDPATRFVYTANSGSDDVSVFCIDHDTGALIPIAGAPFAAGRGPCALAADPSGRYLYVANDIGNNLTVFAVGADGVLRNPGGTPPEAALGPNAMAMDPFGRFLYVLNGFSSDISVYRIDPANGSLTLAPGVPCAVLSGRGALAVDPQGRFLYATNPSANTVSVYEIDAVDGALAEVSGAAFNTGMWPVAAVVAHAPMPALSISDAIVTEPSADAAELIFTVTLSSASFVPVRVRFATGADTATSGADFVPLQGELLFLPGVLTEQIKVQVKADRLAETRESMRVNLASPTNAVIADGEGIGTIDDCQNRPPVFAALKTQAVDEKILLQFTVSASDPDGDALSYAASGLPAGAAFDQATGVFSWTPALDAAGTYSVSFSVSDGKISVSQTVQIIVNNVTAGQLTLRLCDYLDGLEMAEANRIGLRALLSIALESLENKHTRAAVDQLKIFIYKVKAMRGSKLTLEQADELVLRAREIISLINAH